MFQTIVRAVAACVMLAATAASASPRQFLDAAAGEGFPGAVLLVDDGAGRVWSGAAGWRDAEDRDRLRPGDAFHLASISKLFTAAAVLRLADQGKLDLDGKAIGILGVEVMGRLPHGDEITVRQLLDHSSGLYAFNNNLDYLGTLIGPTAHDGRVWTARELVALAYDPANKPRGKPGAGRFYSDTNYVLLGMIVETVSGEPYKDHVQRTIFGPLGMTDTWFYEDRFRNPGRVRLARGYMALSEDIKGFIKIDPRLRRVGSDRLDTTWAGERLAASAGVVSTASDLHRFARALLRGDLVSGGSRAFLLSVLDEVRSLEPGKGRQAVFRAYNTVDGPLLTANGDGPNVNTALVYDPKTGAILIFLSNLFTGEDRENDYIHQKVFAGVLKEIRTGG